MIIHDPKRLNEVLEEISAWALQQRRQYLVDLEAGLGKDAADQIRDGLKRLWAAKS